MNVRRGAAILTAAVALIAGFEGRSLVAYLDPVSIPTICDGYTLGVQMGDVATPQECDAKTAQEAAKSLAVVDHSVDYRLPDPVRVSLTSFVYNVGAGAYLGSTLLKKLRAHDIAAACRQLPRWVYAKGRKLKGLVNRRASEMQLCLSGLN